MRSRLLRTCFALLVCLSTSRLFAAGGTRVIATKGQPVTAEAGWPKGVEQLVNDAARTSGWNSWFSEWPNDVDQYAFEVTTTDEINRLIGKLAAIKTELRQVRLSPLKEPSGLGWVTSVPEGNQIPVIFSLGDQGRIDEWYKHVRKPFGKMEFIAAPVAVPPTLTIFIRNKVVNLDQLKIPKGITVTAGYVPTVFHRANTVDEKKREEEAVRQPAPKATPEKVDAAMQAAVEKIEAFLKKQSDQPKPDPVKPEEENKKRSEKQGSPMGRVDVGLAQRQEHVVWAANSEQAYSTGDFSTLNHWRQNAERWEPAAMKADHILNSITVSRSPESSLVVVGTNVGTAEVWDGKTRQRLAELRSSPEYSVYAVAISPDEALVAACRTDGTVAVFDRATGQLKRRLGEKAEVGTRMASLAFSPDGKILAAMDRYGRLVLWSLSDGAPLAEWKRVAGEDCSVQWSPDGRQVAVTGVGRVTLIPAEKGSEPQIVDAPEEVVSRFPNVDDSRISVSGPFPGGVSYASVTAISVDVRRAASITPDGAVSIWDVTTRKVIRTLPVPGDDVLVKDSAGKGLRNLVFSPDGKRLAATTIRGNVVFWTAPAASE